MTERYKEVLLDTSIRTMYQWNRLEEGAIIDFDLLQQGQMYPGIARDRPTVQEELQIQLASSDKETLRNAKLNSSLWYLRALQGEAIPFATYVENTMGIRPCVIPEKFLQEQLEIINNAYENLGYSWTREGVQGYQQDHALRKDQINEQFHKDAQRLIPIVKNWLGVDIQIPYRMKFVDEDAYWTNWVSTDDTGSLLLQFNINERQKWVKGITEYQVLHELGTHAIQSALMKKAIGDGTLGPLLGLTSTFSFEQFQMEGMAETLFYFLPESPYSSEYGLISQYYENISFLTWNNAHVMANNAKPTSEIVAYVQSYLPHVTDDNIAKAIRERTQNPLDRTYQYIYGIATYYFMQIASLLQSPERKKDFMVDMFTNVYTPQTILSRFDLPN